MAVPDNTEIPLLILRNGPPLQISFVPGTGDTLVVSFAGVGHSRETQPKIELFKVAYQKGRNHVLFVSDASRSWLNGEGLAEAIVETIENVVRQTGAARVVAIGNSMGGTMALFLPFLTNVDAVLSIVPQFSVKPDRVPDEDRWLRYRNRIKHWTFEALDVLPTDRSTVTILHGGTPDELIHLNRFPRDPKARHFVFPAMDHKLAFRLHKRGKLERIVTLAIEGKPWKCRRAIEGAGGKARDDYDQEFSG